MIKEIKLNDYLMGNYPSGYKAAILMNFFEGKADKVLLTKIKSDAIQQMKKSEAREIFSLTEGSYSVDSIHSNCSMYRFGFTLK